MIHSLSSLLSDLVAVVALRRRTGIIGIGVLPIGEAIVLVARKFAVREIL